MKIGVTGGTGFIGQYLLRQYSSAHSFVVVTSREKWNDLFLGSNVNYVHIEYTKQGFKDAFEGCDVIVHLGAKRSDKELEKSILNYMDNLKVSEELFAACVEMGITNVINISSTAVYDTTLSTPYRESDAIAPLSNYGAMKSMIENVAHLYNRKYGMHIKSLRLAQVIGAGERGGYMLSVFLDRCLKGERLNVYGSGKTGREYIYVKDVAFAIMQAIESNSRQEIFNIGNGYITTNLELAQTFCKVFDNQAGYCCLTDKQDALEGYLMDVTRAREELEFSARYDVSAALTDMKKMNKLI